jgi:hypothetical protein
VSTRHVAAGVGEVQVLCDQEPLDGLRRPPHVPILVACQLLGKHRVDVVSEAGEHRDEALRQVLVELELHRLT